MCISEPLRPAIEEGDGESGHEDDGHLPAGVIAGGASVTAAAASGDAVVEKGLGEAVGAVGDGYIGEG
jgi:hypothetical protein